MTGFSLNNSFLPEILSLHGKWRESDIAVVCGDQSLTWGQFDENQNRIANGLLACGLNKGAKVAVVMSNSIEMLEILFGIIRADCVVVPINISVSDDGISSMIKDCDAEALFISEDHFDRFKDINFVKNTICVGDNYGGWINYDIWKNKQDTRFPDVKYGFNDPINIIYSSGTTGAPKGIVHSHQGRLNFAYSLAPALHYYGKINTLVTLGLYSNISWASMLCTLIYGGTLIIQKKFDVVGFLEIVAEKKITHSSMVPIQFQRILETAGQESYDLSSLRSVMSCGSPLQASLKELFSSRISGSLIDLYGLTEGLITTLEPADNAHHNSSVGRPVAGVDLKIINTEGKEESPYIIGEIVGQSNFIMPAGAVTLTQKLPVFTILKKIEVF